MRLGESIRAVLLAILALSASAACLEAALLLREARLKLDAVAGDLNGLIRPTQQLEANWNAVAVTSAQVLAKERAAFGEQQLYFQRLSTDSEAALGKVNIVLDDTDVAVRATNADLDEVAVTLHGADLAIANDSSAAASVLQAVQGSFGKVDSVTLPIAESMQKLDGAMTDVQGMAKDSHAVTTDAAAFVHRELAPVRGVKNTIKAGLDWAYKIKLLIF